MNEPPTTNEKRLGYCLLAYLVFSYAFMWFVLKWHADWLDISGPGWTHDEMSKNEKFIFWLFSPITMPCVFGFKGIVEGIQWLSGAMF